MDAAHKVDNQINVAVANPAGFKHLYPITSDVKVNREKPFIIIYEKNNQQTVMNMEDDDLDGFFSNYLNPEGTEENAAEETDQGVKDEL